MVENSIDVYSKKTARSQRKLISGLQDVSASEHQNLGSILISSNETFHVVCVMYASVYTLLVTLVLYHRIDCDGEKLERVSTQMDSNELKASPHSNSPELDSIIEDVESSLSSLKGHRK